MLWVWVFLGIALAGLVMLICYAVWLAHLTADVFSEVVVLGERTGTLVDLLSQVGAAPEVEGAATETGRGARARR